MKALVLAAALAGLLPGDGSDDAHLFPVEAEGDIRFDLDAARFHLGNGLATDLYIAIPQMFLTHSADSAGYAHIEIQTDFRDVDGNSISESAEELYLALRPRDDGDVVLAPRLLVTLRPEVPPGTDQFRVRVTDLEGRKRGLLDRIRGKRTTGEAIGRFGQERNGCGSSDIVFAWDVEREKLGSGSSLRESLAPNPRRYYGLFHTTLLCYVENYGDDPRVRYEIRRGDGGDLVLSGVDSSSTIRASNGVGEHLISADLSKFPSGLYTLEIQPASGDTCSTTARFQVLWEPTSWSQDEKTLLEEAFVILNPTEYERVREMSRGEIEVYMRDLWAEHDPHPSTGVNELYETYRARVDHADRFFGTAIRRGMLSDRGRVYIRYGPADEITKELNPQDQDLLSKVLPGELAEDRYDQVRTTRRRNARDDRAYEIWSYTMHGAPLFPDQEAPVQRSNIRFIFVDEMGYGDMRLVYTNLIGAF